MDKDQFLRSGVEAVEYVAEFTENIRTKASATSVSPGYIRELVPSEAPETGDRWEAVLKDIDRVIIPGLSNLASPACHAFFPFRTSYPSIIGSMLTEALQMCPSTWEWSPAGTELEVLMMDWLGKMLHLPSKFLTDSGGSGGGVLQSSGSESTLISLLSARAWAIRRHKTSHPDVEEDAMIISKMVAYCSQEAHSSLQKAGLVAVIKLRKLETDANFSMRGPTLQKAIREDRAKGLIPIFACATLATTGPCSFDDLAEIGPVCEAEDVWLHVDAAYAGNFFICPEFRPLLNGVEFSKSFYFNPHKSLHVGTGCSAMWVSDRSLIEGTFHVNATYLYPEHVNNGTMPDYRDWQFDLSRQCRSLKLWLVLRMYGVKQLQELAMKDVGLARWFEALVREDCRFEIVSKVVLGAVCFRLKANDESNRELLRAVNEGRKISLGPTTSRDFFYLRLIINSSCTTVDDIEMAWQVIQHAADGIL